MDALTAERYAWPYRRIQQPPAVDPEDEREQRRRALVEATRGVRISPTSHRAEAP